MTTRITNPEWFAKPEVPQPPPAVRDALLMSRRWMYFLAPICGHPDGFESMRQMRDQAQYLEAVKAMRSEPTWPNSCGHCKHRQEALQWWPYGGYQN